MHFYTKSECEEWLAGRNLTKPNEATTLAALRLAYPKQQSLCYWARWIAKSLAFQQPCLLWITDWGIFSSSENLHLYYRLRQSYHDVRMLHEAPGHLFLNYETEDLATFIQVAMQNFWDGHILDPTGNVKIFFSHDEFIYFYTDEASVIADIKKNLTG
jgi:hypothetical protein